MATPQHDAGISPKRRFYHIAKHPDPDRRTPPRGTTGRVRKTPHQRRPRRSASRSKPRVVP